MAAYCNVHKKRPSKQMTGQTKLPRYLAAIQAVSVLLAICSAVEAGEKPPTPRFIVVTTPIGEGDEAEIARSLVPEEKKGKYELTPIDALKDNTQADRVRDIEHQVEETVLKAREAALAFNLVLAARLKRQAADGILQTEITALDASLTATYLLEAGAASVDAGEKDLALTYFRKALAVDRDIRPGPTLSPQANKAFDAALALGPSRLRTPADLTLRKLCAILNVEGVLWISVGRDEQGLIVSDKFLLLREQVSEQEISQHPPRGKDNFEPWSLKERNRLDMAMLAKLPKEPAPRKPWYKKWWIYVAVGGVLVAGAAAGIGIAATLPPKEADVVVHH